MNIPSDGQTQHGKILCPTPRCGEKLGHFAHYGMKCSCARWVCPAYQILKSKVDQIVDVDLMAGNNMAAAGVPNLHIS